MRRPHLMILAAIAATLIIIPALLVSVSQPAPADEPKPTDASSSTPFETFQAGIPGSFVPWASSTDAAPALRTEGDATRPGAAPDNAVLIATVAAAGETNGFTFEERDGDHSRVSDWSAFDGFSFWFLGRGTGRTLTYETHNRAADGTELAFESSVVDDAVGWRKVGVLFAELTPKPGVDAREFNPGASTGFAVALTDLGPGSFAFDDFALDQRAVLIDDFEQGITKDEKSGTGYVPRMSRDTKVTVGTAPRARDTDDNHALTGTYAVDSDGWGRVTRNLATPADYSSFRGIRFWWYASQANNPASPSAGADIRVVIMDGGPDGDHAENWSATFKDNWSTSGSRWKLVSLPFSSFQPAGHQPGEQATRNGVLDLTSVWGFAFAFPSAPTTTDTEYAIDDVQLYGTPHVGSGAAVTTDEGVYLVDAGTTARVALVIQTRTGEPLEDEVAVAWRTGSGSAQAGRDYTAASGTVTFPAGSDSGTKRVITIEALPGSPQSSALSVPLQFTTTASTPASAPQIVVNARGLPYLDPALPTAERVDDLLARMTPAEKAGQMAQAERLGLSDSAEIGRLGLGSLLSGGGSLPDENTPEAWAEMVDGYQRHALATRLQIPLLYGVDAVHGHSNVEDATIYPHNIGLGATRDPALVEQVSRQTAVETRTTGVNWTFAPCLCVSRDERWGRTYESFGEDPALVSLFARATVVGLQGEEPADLSAPGEVLGTAKHWAGDGGTTYDPSVAGTGEYPIDQGITDVASQEEFERLHVAPYVPAITAGVGTIMPSYSAPSIAGGDAVRMTEHPMNQSLLKDRLGFAGFLISDWRAIDKLPGDDYSDKVVRAINGGALDMAMAPYNSGDFIAAVVSGVETGRISPARIDDAVRRILTAKFALGLFESPFADTTLRDRFGSAEHRETAAEAAAKSQVLLKDSGGALPLAKSGKLYLAGSGADDLGNQMGGWTVLWQGQSGNDTRPGTTIREGIASVAPDLEVTFSADASEDLSGHDAGLVVVSEAPYAEGLGDVGNNGHTLELSAEDRAAVEKVCSALDTCVVLVISGRPLFLDGVGVQADAIVAGFLPGSQGDGVARVLLGDLPFTGRLPLSWPTSESRLPINVGDAEYDPAWAYGWGLRTDMPRDRLEGIVDELTGDSRAAVRALLDADVWAADGSLEDVPTGVRLAIAAARTLSQTDRAAVENATAAQAAAPSMDTTKLAHADTVVSIVRDAAHEAIGDGAGADAADKSAFARAEHLSVAGANHDAALEFASLAGIRP